MEWFAGGLRAERAEIELGFGFGESDAKSRERQMRLAPLPDFVLLICRVFHIFSTVMVLGANCPDEQIRRGDRLNE